MDRETAGRTQRTRIYLEWTAIGLAGLLAAAAMERPCGNPLPCAAETAEPRRTTRPAAAPLLLPADRQSQEEIIKDMLLHD